jgi:LysM repeat protein
MKRYFVLLIAIIGILEIGYASNNYLLDSLSTIQKEGKKYVMHQVESGETLFALSRRYNVSVQEIKDANTEPLSSLDVGQKVLIPLAKTAIEGNAKTHTVSSSETLFSISRNYNVQVDDIKRWNNLTDNSISVGQELIVSEGTELKSAAPSNIPESVNRKNHTVEESQTLYSISRMYGVTTDQIIKWNNLASSNLSIGQVLIVSVSSDSEKEVVKNSSMLPASGAEASSSTTVNVTPVEAKPAKSSSPSVVAAPVITKEPQNDLERIEAPVQKVIQKGLAEVIADTENTKKYLAMHRDAPIGTIMQVKNEMNNQTVFVRVVGPIQPTGDNGKIILMISKKAFDRLGAVDNRFPVEVSYIP